MLDVTKRLKTKTIGKTITMSWLVFAKNSEEVKLKVRAKFYLINCQKLHLDNYKMKCKK